MSLSKQTTVWCDYPDCGQWVMESGTAAEVRKSVKRSGWTQKGKQDFCEGCSKKRKEST